jgi:hypothetical protein
MHSRQKSLLAAQGGFLHLVGLVAIIVLLAFGYFWVSGHRSQIDGKLTSVGLPAVFSLKYTVVGKELSGGRYELILREGSNVQTIIVPRALYQVTKLGDKIKH